MPAALNLSNEVVKLRAEVKRTKVLVLRKLTRQIAALKRKKGTQADLERNQRRAARLLEEIHELKTLAPDSITKAALQQDLSFQKVCQNKAASLSERAMARVATHPEFSRRIQTLKEAIKAFKTERISAAKAGKTMEGESGSSVLQQCDSELDSDGESEEEDEGADGSSVVQIADTEGVSKMTEQDKCVSVTTKEESFEAHNMPTEVVRMRKEVKKLRILLIRKLTQQIISLRKSKDQVAEIKGSQQRITELQKEVQDLRAILPDQVTIMLLQGKVDLENVLQDPKSSSLEKATARIGTHPRFIKKLLDVRKAIEEEKTQVLSAEPKIEGTENIGEVSNAEDGDEEQEEGVEDEGEKAVSITDDSNDTDDETEVKERKQDQRSNAIKMSKDTKSHTVNETPVSNSKEVTKEDLESLGRLRNVSKTAVTAGIVKSLPSKSKEIPARRAPPPGRKELQTEKKPENTGSKEESDLDLSDGDEEREYFDDSTEERFHKQSSQSEESDDDDFFLGKVSKFKKKKSDVAPEKEEKRGDPTKVARLPKDPEAGVTHHEFKVQSVFCSTLSRSSDAPQKGKNWVSGPPHTHNRKKCPDGNAKPWFKSQDSRTDRRHTTFNKPAAGPRGPAPGPRTAAGARFGKLPAQGKKGGPGQIISRPQQALHPSWEASKKRKEQQAQITAFQGKKIKFDDD